MPGASLEEGMMNSSRFMLSASLLALASCQARGMPTSSNDASGSELSVVQPVKYAEMPGADTNGAAPTPESQGAPQGPQAAGAKVEPPGGAKSRSLPSRGPLTLYGAGPQGFDNGSTHACTGVRGTGQQILCVRAGAGAGGAGTASAPFSTISAAVAQARNGDVIQVAGGDSPGAKLEYREGIHIGEWTNHTCDNGGIPKNLIFLGGFTKDFRARNANEHRTYVIGNREWPSFLLCVHSGTTVVDGFYVTTQNTNRGLVGSVGGFGSESGQLVFSHNVVFENKAKDINDETAGGGISLKVYAYGTGEVSGNHSHHNETGRGAGISTSSENRKGRWGTVRILRNRVENNLSRASHGGGMNISGAAEIAYNVVLNNRLLGSDWGGFGAGFIAEGQSNRAPVSAHHNVVMGNQGAGYAGSGEFYDEDVVATVKFDFVADNGCVDQERTSEVLVDGGNQRKSIASFANITVANHVCPAMRLGAMVIQGESQVSIDKSVFWNNIGVGGGRLDFGIDAAGTPRLADRFTITNTVSGQVVSGTGNKSDDPGFIDPKRGNYHASKYPDRGAFAPGGLDPKP